MGTNHHFQQDGNTGEQELMHDLVAEVIQIHGTDLIYIPRESNVDILQRDDLFGEDYISYFSSKFPIEMYLENADGMEGEGDLLAKFGVVIRDSATFVCARRRFDEATPYLLPKEGDLLYYPVTGKLFEITYVGFENPFWQFGKLYTFKINVELFNFSEERFDTGIDKIDNIPLERSYTTFFDLNSGGTGTFTDGETITVSGSAFSGEVSDFDADSLLLKVIYSAGDSNAPTNGFITGGDSGASWGISSGDSFLMENEGFADNKYFENTDVIDESEDFFLGDF